MYEIFVFLLKKVKKIVDIRLYTKTGRENQNALLSLFRQHDSPMSPETHRSRMDDNTTQTVKSYVQAESTIFTEHPCMEPGYYGERKLVQD